MSRLLIASLSVILAAGEFVQERTRGRLLADEISLSLPASANNGDGSAGSETTGMTSEPLSAAMLLPELGEGETIVAGPVVSDSVISDSMISDSARQELEELGIFVGDLEGKEILIGPQVTIEGPQVTVEVPQALVPAKNSNVLFGDWLGYNPTQSDTTWLAGGDFGMFSLESFPTIALGADSGLAIGMGFHFLNGPIAPDLPPRLFDFQIAYQARKVVSPNAMIDIKFGVGAFSDFDGSARKGIRFPGHYVTYYEWEPQFVTVLGVEVLDRDDITMLPVAGFVWRPKPDLMFEMVFPRPKVQLRLNDNRAMYFGGELGGGTWAIRRSDFGNDNLTYRDLRMTVGMVEFGKSSDTVLEIGWAFDRQFEFRSGIESDPLDSALILRCHRVY